MLHKYRKTALIEAEQFDGSIEACIKYPIFVAGFRVEMVSTNSVPRELKTKEGNMSLHLGDYIATGVDGEHWAIDQDIFERTYERCD